MTSDDWVWSWFRSPDLIACSYPTDAKALEQLGELGVRTLVNLDELGHEPKTLDAIGMIEVQIPIADFEAPSPAQIDEFIEIVQAAQPVIAVHCRAGLGRTGTMLACLLVITGLGAEDAIAQIRATRPGSIETLSQEDAIHAFAIRSTLRNQTGI